MPASTPSRYTSHSACLSPLLRFSSGPASTFGNGVSKGRRRGSIKLLVGRSDDVLLRYRLPDRYDLRSFPRINEASSLYGWKELEDPDAAGYTLYRILCLIFSTLARCQVTH